jgi:hypothetical protein
MKKIIVFLWFFLAIVTGKGMAMELDSPEFGNNEYVPEKFKYTEENINPELSIKDIPAGTKSLALIFDDPDAPGKVWAHWVMFNIPVVSGIKEDSVPGRQGSNDFGRIGYDGPYPPSGVHRYVFKVYALDAMLDLKEGASKADLERAMEGHVLARAELTGLCKK